MLRGRYAATDAAPDAGAAANLSLSAPLDLDVQPLDLLVQGGERHMETLGGLRLVPSAALQHGGNHPTFAVFHNLKQ